VPIQAKRARKREHRGSSEQAPLLELVATARKANSKQQLQGNNRGRELPHLAALKAIQEQAEILVKAQAPKLVCLADRTVVVRAEKALPENWEMAQLEAKVAMEVLVLPY
jgi:hypothetical protein